MLEKRIERRFYNGIKKLGGRAIKFVSPTMDSLPDRIVFMPNGRVYLVELKRPGKEPSEKQWIIIKMFRGLGHYAGYLDTIEKVDEFLNYLRRG